MIFFLSLSLWKEKRTLSVCVCAVRARRLSLVSLLSLPMDDDDLFKSALFCGTNGCSLL